jgi:hypothetical protein
MKNRIPLLLPALQVALLLLTTVALYAQSLSAPFVFDDLDFFENREMLWKYGHTYFHFDSRWLSYSTLGWTVRGFGLDLFWLRLGNVLLHAANAIALFFLLRRLFQVTLADTANSTPPSLAWLAFLGALIFALHPISVYGVAYLIERSILMATLFVLLMLLFYLEGILPAPRPPEGRVSGGVPFTGVGGWRWMLAAALCYFAAVYSKEHSITAPGVALAMTFLVRKPSAALFKQIAPYFLLTALIAVTILLSVKGVLGELYEPRALVMLDRIGLSDLPNVHWLSILTQSALFFKYLGLWLVPDPAWMSVDMRESFAVSFFSWPHTLGMAAFLAYPCAAVWLLLKQGRLGLLGFALLFPWILFLTEWSVIRIQEPFVLYRSYLWMPGLFAALPVLFNVLSPRRTFILLAAFCLLLVPLTLNRMNTFSSPFLLWDDAEKLVRNKPDAHGVRRIYYNRGTELGKLKRYDEALSDFNKAIAEDPSLAQQYSNRGANYYYQGKYPEALKDYDHAISIESGNPKSYYGRALAYRALGNFAAAQEDFIKSCALGLCIED